MPVNLEVADILRRHGDAFRRAHDGHLNRIERRVMSTIELFSSSARRAMVGSVIVVLSSGQWLVGCTSNLNRRPTMTTAVDK
jgi:hypothetical protein